MGNSTRWPRLGADILQSLPVEAGQTIASGDLIQRVRQRLRADPPSRDTILRALESLESEGLVHKQGTSRDRIWWRTEKQAPNNTAKRPPLELAIALLTLKRHAHTHLPSHVVAQLQAYFDGAEKLLIESPADPLLNEARAWQEKTVRIEAGYPLVSPPVDSDILNAVRRALYTSTLLDITYQNSRLDSDRPTSYKAMPVGLVERGPVLYVVATRRSRSGSYRYYHLRLDRFVSAVCTDTAGERDPAFDLEEHVRKQEYFSFFPGEKIRIKLRVREDDDIRHLFREQWLSLDQEIIDEPGGFLLCATVTLSLALRNLLMERSARVEVLSPAGLRQEIAANLRLASRCYE
ncbi:WYL domain-containing protein [Cupriavidus plantarum]|uniref:WYL domain-containing protein n=1 Tax=Cupriavidus plantarum TaxID=942865 RepID=A0A316EYD5_9BURK|nr:WYL domain-containing protein [Cupriavidus plantarum]